MHLCNNNLSTFATSYSIFKSELFPACFSSYKNFSLSHNSLGSDGKSDVEVTEALIAGDLINFIRVFSLLLFPSFCLILKVVSLPNS